MPQPPEKRSHRTPSRRTSALLAALLLGAGIAIGAAIGPAPSPSYAGDAVGVAQRLIASLAAASQTSTPASTASAPAPQTPPASVEPTPAAAAPALAPAASVPAPAAAEGPAESKAPTTRPLPAVTNVWLIELAGGSIGQASAQPAAAPSLTGTVFPAATVLKDWSALDGSAFASAAALAQKPVAGAAPPLLHSIVQPPCPEGAAGAACAPGTAGELTAADQFLAQTLAQITGTPAYREHGLVVVTFTTVAIASQAGLPASASSATLTYQPPTGVALLSPFAHAGVSSAAFNPSSPRRSLEKLLR
jgi:hypothetical protein